MAGFTDTVSISYQTPAGVAAAVTTAYTGNTEQNASSLCNINATTEIDVTFIKANLQSLLLYCDQTITLKTNSSGAPQDTLNVKANVAFVWNTDLASIFTCPFSNNVTKFFVVGASANVNATCTFNFRSVQNN